MEDSPTESSYDLVNVPQKVKKTVTLHMYENHYISLLPPESKCVVGEHVSSKTIEVEFEL